MSATTGMATAHASVRRSEGYRRSMDSLSVARPAGPGHARVSNCCLQCSLAGRGRLRQLGREPPGRGKQVDIGLPLVVLGDVGQRFRVAGPALGIDELEVRSEEHTSE